MFLFDFAGAKRSGEISKFQIFKVASFSFQKVPKSPHLGRRGAYRTVVRPSSVSTFDQLYLYSLQADLSHFNLYHAFSWGMMA